MRPVLDRIIIKIDPPSNVTESGFYIPTENALKQNMATVVAVGPGEYDSSGKRKPIPLKEGDRIVLPEGVTEMFEHDDQEFHVTQYSNVLGVLSE